MSDFSDHFHEVVRETGTPIHMGTAFCDSWKESHENCRGCESEMGCNKAVKLMLITLTPMSYQPSSFQDFQTMQRRISELTKQILEAKSMEELELIPNI